MFLQIRKLLAHDWLQGKGEYQLFYAYGSVAFTGIIRFAAALLGFEILAVF